MKIVQTDNFDRERYKEKVIADNVNEYWATIIAQAINDMQPENSDWFYKAVPDNYKLYIPDWMVNDD